MAENATPEGASVGDKPLATDGADAPPNEPRGRQPKRAIIIGIAMALLVVADAVMLVLVSGWKSEREDLVAELESTGTDKSAAEALAAENAAEVDLLTQQVADAIAAEDDLTQTETTQIADLDAMHDAIDALWTCSKDQTELVKDLWRTSASAQSKQKKAVDKTCDSAIGDFKAATSG